MLSAVLRSETAINVSILVINAFVEMRRSIAEKGSLLQRLDSLEKRQIHCRVGCLEILNRQIIFDC